MQMVRCSGRKWLEYRWKIVNEISLLGIEFKVDVDDRGFVYKLKIRGRWRRYRDILRALAMAMFEKYRRIAGCDCRPKVKIVTGRGDDGKTCERRYIVTFKLGGEVVGFVLIYGWGEVEKLGIAMLPLSYMEWFVSKYDEVPSFDVVVEEYFKWRVERMLM